MKNRKNHRLYRLPEWKPTRRLAIANPIGEHDECGFTGGYMIIQDYMREQEQRVLSQIFHWICNPV
jgi:hypothetical protein